MRVSSAFVYTSSLFHFHSSIDPLLGIWCQGFVGKFNDMYNMIQVGIDSFSRSCLI